MKIVATNRLFPQTRTLFPEGVDLVSSSSETPLGRAEVLAEAREAQALIAFMTDRIDEAFLSACPRLQVVGAALKGYDNIDVEAATEAGVWVTIVPDLLTVPTAELTIALMLALGRHIVPADRTVRDGAFEGWRPQFYGTGLEGSTIGLVGYGAVGRAIARRLVGFDCTMIAYDPDGVADDAAQLADFDEVLGSADVVVLALPLTAATLGLIGRAALARLKPGALLVNPARGSLVDETAVADALESGRLGGYAADVFACEDLSRPDRPSGIDPRLTAPEARTVLTPHIGSAVAMARQSIERSAAESILAALSGAVPPFAVNRPRLRTESAC